MESRFFITDSWVWCLGHDLSPCASIPTSVGRSPLRLKYRQTRRDRLGAPPPPPPRPPPEAYPQSYLRKVGSERLRSLTVHVLRPPRKRSLVLIPRLLRDPPRWYGRLTRRGEKRTRSTPGRRPPAMCLPSPTGPTTPTVRLASRVAPLPGP